jgi:hypothetical protein
VPNARTCIRMLLATALGAAVMASAGPAAAEPPAPDASARCAKGKVTWQLNGRLGCARAPKPGGSAEPPAAALTRAWVRDASRRLPGGKRRLPRKLKRALPAVTRRAGRFAVRIASMDMDDLRRRRRARSAADPNVVSVHVVAPTVKLDGGVTLESSADRKSGV